MSDESLNGVTQDGAGEAIPRLGQFVSEGEDTAEGETRPAGSDLLSSGGMGGGAEPRRSRGDAESPIPPSASRASGVPPLSGPQRGVKPRAGGVRRSSVAMSRDEREL